MSISSFFYDNQLNFDLLESWFELCDEFKEKFNQNVFDNEQELDKFVEFSKNDDLIRLIFQILENSSYHEQYLEEICKHLFKLYLSKNQKLQVFVLSFVPTLIGINLINSLNSKLKSDYNFIDVFLIGVYNFSLINEDGTIKERSFRLPNLNKSSIYHFPEINTNLSEAAIKKLEQCYKENRIAYVLDNVDLHFLNATNRMVVYFNLIQIYHDSISLLSKECLFAYCRMCNSILFYNTKTFIENSDLIDDIDKPINYVDILNKCKPKLQFSSNFLLQLLNCLYFCIYNGCEKEGKECIIEIHNKAKSALLTDVLLMTNAILSSLELSKQGLENECMGINISFSPNSEITTTTGQTKSAITNASFKTQKLPEDIEIIPIKNEVPDVIQEETDHQNDRNFTSQLTNQMANNKQMIKDNLQNGLTTSSISKHAKEKKEKKKKRTKSSSTQEDLNLQMLNSNESDNRTQFKISYQTKSNQHLNNDFLLESMKLINHDSTNERKLNQIDPLNEEKLPLVKRENVN